MMNNPILRTRPSHRRGAFMGGVTKAQYLNLTAPAIINQRYQDGGNTAIIDIDGFIGRDMIREAITGEKSKNTVENIRRVLRGIDSDKIIVNINSPGGDLNDGLVIYNMLQAHRAEIITNTMGFSASAATVIAQAGDTRRQAREGFQLIHRVMFGLMGYFNQNTFRELTADAETIDPVLMKLYAKRSKLSTKRVADIMDEGGGYGRWMDADEALGNGMVDDVFDASDETDENVDRLSPDDKAQMKRNVQILAGAGAAAAKNTDRQARMAEVEELERATRPSGINTTSATTGARKLPHVKSARSESMAYHEAGHAIIGVALGETVSELEMHRRQNGSVGGSCLFVNGDTKMRQYMLPWQYLAVSVAGSMAQQGYTGSYMKEFDLNDLNGDANDPGSDKYHVKEILSGLTGNERSRIVSAGIGYAASRLMRNWGHVKELAFQLDERGSMNKEEFSTWLNKATRYTKFYT